MEIFPWNQKRENVEFQRICTVDYVQLTVLSPTMICSLPECAVANGFQSQTVARDFIFELRRYILIKSPTATRNLVFSSVRIEVSQSDGKKAKVHKGPTSCPEVWSCPCSARLGVKAPESLHAQPQIQRSKDLTETALPVITAQATRAQKTIFEQVLDPVPR